MNAGLIHSAPSGELAAVADSAGAVALSLETGWRRRSSRSAASAMVLVGSVSDAHWRRVSWAVARVAVMLVALACMACQSLASSWCRAAVAGPAVDRAAWSARMAF